MKITNHYNLPDSLLRVANRREYTGEKVDLRYLSATTSYKPPKIRMLTARHMDDLVVDVSDMLWIIQGDSSHYVVDRVSGEGFITNRRFEAEVEDHVVNGEPDLFQPAVGLLEDYKFTSVWKAIDIIKGKDHDYETQLRIYTFLLQTNGYDVKKAQIVFLLRDWSKIRAQEDNDNYPKMACAVKEVDIWDQPRRLAYISHLVREHARWEDVPDDEIPECTPEERWSSKAWALMKKGRKSAIKLYDFEHEARLAIRGESGLYVENRPQNTDKRCKFYCSVRHWCHYGKRYE